MDAEMPEISGFDLAEQMRQQTGWHGRMVMMLSSAGNLADAAKCRKLGIRAHVIKPIHPGDLQNVIVRSLREMDEQPGAVFRAANMFPRISETPLSVLLVEDNAVNRKLAVRLLEKQGHTVITANNGREALEALDQLRWDLDLILMDVQMPEMDGYQTTAAIREREKHTGRRLPIIAMTAHALDRDRERCVAAGMDAYISKPIEPQKLFELIESTVRILVAEPV
jgi:CheY-like chemotaxis protein